jgi:cytochrome c5
MRLQPLISTVMLACYCLLSSAQAPDASHAKAAAQPVKIDAGKPSQQPEVGEQKFQQNCSRCHNAPQELPRRITGTVVLHMRARASLSAADARAILRYLAP